MPAVFVDPDHLTLPPNQGEMLSLVWQVEVFTPPETL